MRMDGRNFFNLQLTKKNTATFVRKKPVQVMEKAFNLARPKGASASRPFKYPTNEHHEGENDEAENL